jgi:hypothetical protein
MKVRRIVLTATTTALLLLPAAAAGASDHVRTGADNGKPDFGVSDPSCVPGQGDPKSGDATGTPSADRSVSCRP